MQGRMPAREKTPSLPAPLGFAPLGQAVMETFSEGVVVFDPYGRILYANQRARRTLDALGDGAPHRGDNLRERLMAFGGRTRTLKQGSLAQIIAPMGRAVPERVEGTPRPLVRVQDPAIGVEDDHALAECFHHGLPERGEAQRGRETGGLFSRGHTSLHSRGCASGFQTAPHKQDPRSVRRSQLADAASSDADPPDHPYHGRLGRSVRGAAVLPGTGHSTGGAGPPTDRKSTRLNS